MPAGALAIAGNSEQRKLVARACATMFQGSMKREPGTSYAATAEVDAPSDGLDLDVLEMARQALREEAKQPGIFDPRLIAQANELIATTFRLQAQPAVELCAPRCGLELAARRWARRRRR